MSKATIVRLFLLLFFFVLPSFATVFQWSSACGASYFDYFGTLYFCQDGKNVFNYRSDRDSPCTPTETAPILRLQAGKRYQLRLVNLSTDAPTNLHTHGLHIPGEGNADDVRRLAEPNGGELLYNWTIPSTHMDGTFWYHPHAHGQAYQQGQGGAMGMLLVDPSPNMVDDRPAWTTRERLVEILDASHLPFLFTKVRANGQKTTTIPLQRNQWHRLRVNFVAYPVIAKYMLFDGGGCELRAAAYDGVWRDVVPSPRAQSIYRLFHSNRADFAIKCSGKGGDMVYTSMPQFTKVLRGVMRWFGLQNLMYTPLLKFDVTDDGVSVDEDGAPDEWIPTRPPYLQDLRNEDIGGDTYSVRITTHDVNGVEYSDDEAPLQHFAYGSTQQWHITDGPLVMHPFHLHLYHMQIVSPGGCGYMYEEGQWYDTVTPTAQQEGCRVRFRMLDVSGRAVLHCHVPLHAKQGAVGYVMVDDGPSMVAEDVYDVNEDAAVLCTTE